MTPEQAASQPAETGAPSPATNPPGDAQGEVFSYLDAAGSEAINHFVQIGWLRRDPDYDDDGFPAYSPTHLGLANIDALTEDLSEAGVA